ncbi:hypothetical protein PoMZ_09151 [Pyricularia oryzae]|uniref:Uncharacterized protein n=1 Tax=Pyricularia oryzae TaxID=318829 RepID=A0A4P7MW76_PYROR|nr:hypothetical protein PoMZ_09151 [Pyricularia oryzae]
MHDHNVLGLRNIYSEHKRKPDGLADGMAVLILTLLKPLSAAEAAALACCMLRISGGQPRSPFGLVCTAAAPMLCASKEERPQHVEYGGNECQPYEAFTLARFSLGCEPWRSRRDASYLAAQEASMSWNGDFVESHGYAAPN